jgi:streptogramin lyase
VILALASVISWQAFHQTGGISEFPVPNGHPDGITAGPDGNLWFTEDIGGNIGRISTSGTITEFPLPFGSSPDGITAGPDGNLWFTDEDGNIGRITPGGTITEFPVPTTNSFPSWITKGSDGNLWFTELHSTHSATNNHTHEYDFDTLLTRMNTR